MSAPVCNPFCPFLACATCGWQGGDTRAVQSEIPGLTSGNRVGYLLGNDPPEPFLEGPAQRGISPAYPTQPEGGLPSW